MLAPVDETQPKELAVNALHLTWLLERGRGGVHPLFDTHVIRRAVMNAPAEMPEEDDMLPRLQRHIRDLAALPTLADQRAFILSLSDGVQDLMVLLYFRFLDQFMQGRELTLH